MQTFQSHASILWSLRRSLYRPSTCHPLARRCGAPFSCIVWSFSVLPARWLLLKLPPSYPASERDRDCGCRQVPLWNVCSTVCRTMFAVVASSSFPIDQKWLCRRFAFNQALKGAKVLPCRGRGRRLLHVLNFVCCGPGPRDRPFSPTALAWKTISPIIGAASPWSSVLRVLDGRRSFNVGSSGSAPADGPNVLSGLLPSCSLLRALPLQHRSGLRSAACSVLHANLYTSSSFSSSS